MDSHLSFPFQSSSICTIMCTLLHSWHPSILCVKFDTPHHARIQYNITYSSGSSSRFNPFRSPPWESATTRVTQSSQPYRALTAYNTARQKHSNRPSAPPRAHVWTRSLDNLRRTPWTELIAPCRVPLTRPDIMPWPNTGTRERVWVSIFHRSSYIMVIKYW